MSTTSEESHLAVTAEQVWRALTKASFAVIGHVTPTGAPRSSGVVYTIADRRMLVFVDADGWKARHIAASGQVGVTVPVRRGGILSLLFPIPPATITFHGPATVHPSDSPEGRRAARLLGSLLPPGSLATSRIIEIRPEGEFLTYGVGVSLMRMRDPALAGAHVPVT
jgi:hypothetical protein